MPAPAAASLRVALRSQPVYAAASLQPLINFGFALKARNVLSFGSGAVGLDFQSSSALRWYLKVTRGDLLMAPIWRYFA